ncbi:cytochrome P450 [Metabacillus idriensis]|uniref:cytochrome P450 n=1 Tax=Metabacillus idriensis TaxID=324768 RepID=UPI0028134357|nr:cytochrome P450 [Metabacillus idriensis]MDR0139043.1 cytochrome P450 [Metabacillus idriensis]
MTVSLGGSQLSNYLAFRKDPLRFLLNTHTLGDIVAINPHSRNTSYIIHSREAVKQILTIKEEYFEKGSSARTLGKTLGNGVLTSEGEEHRQQRKMMQPAFHKRKIAGYAEIVNSMTEDMIGSWENGETRPIHEDMMNLTLRIIVKTMFGVELSQNTGHITKAVNYIIEKTASSLLTPFSPPDFLPTSQNRKYKRGVQTLDELADFLMEEGSVHSSEDHLLSLLLETKYENGQGLSKREIRDQIVTMLIAGHETTANLLTWVFALLARHPNIEERMLRELALFDNSLKFEDLKNLPFFNQVIQETLRLYPSAWIMLREAKADAEILNEPFKKGSIFLISPYVMHRNPAYFADAEEFNPDRFSIEKKDEIPMYGYFPFGGGSRGCIGSQFAMMEAVLISAAVLKHYRLEQLAGDKHELKPEPLVSLRIKNGLSMTVLKR